MFFRKAVVWLIILGLGGFSTGCRQVTRIKTKPENAEIWVNLVKLDNSPTDFITRTGFPDTARLKIAHPDYESVRDYPIEKSYHADVSLLWLIPGIIPYFFTARFEDEVVIELKPKTR